MKGMTKVNMRNDRRRASLSNAEAARLGVANAQATLRAALAGTDERLWLAASLERRPDVLVYAVGSLAIALTFLVQTAFPGRDADEVFGELFASLTESAAVAQARTVLAGQGVG